MFGNVIGPDALLVLLMLMVGVGGLVVTIWAVVDAASRPSAAFAAARSSKAMWITLIVEFYFLTGLVGMVLAVVYLASIRPRVKAVSPRY
jgi:hypothetical protein